MRHVLFGNQPILSAYGVWSKKWRFALDLTEFAANGLKLAPWHYRVEAFCEIFRYFSRSYRVLFGCTVTYIPTNENGRKPCLNWVGQSTSGNGTISQIKEAMRLASFGSFLVDELISASLLFRENRGQPLLETLWPLFPAPSVDNWLLAASGSLK